MLADIDLVIAFVVIPSETCFSLIKALMEDGRKVEKPPPSLKIESDDVSFVFWQN